MYGKHLNCPEKWCKFNKNPDSFKFKSLPYGRPLQDPDLRLSLEKLVKQYQGCVDRLAYLSSTQVNESFNNTVTSKAPKSR